MGETTFAIVFFCACMLFLSAVGYFAFGVLAKFYAFIKFAVRLCSQDPKFSLAMFAPAFILSLYTALVSQNLVFDFYLERLGKCFRRAGFRIAFRCATFCIFADCKTRGAIFLRFFVSFGAFRAALRTYHGDHFKGSFCHLRPVRRDFTRILRMF